MAEWSRDGTSVRVTRPVAADVRDWRDLMEKVLNRLDVHVGEEFEIRQVRPSNRRPILSSRSRDDNQEALT